MSVSVVTGGTRGIGAAISRRVASDGGHVAAVYHADERAAQKFVTDAKADGLDISAHRAELADAGACTAVMAEIAETFGPVRHPLCQPHQYRRRDVFRRAILTP